MGWMLFKGFLHARYAPATSTKKHITSLRYQIMILGDQSYCDAASFNRRETACRNESGSITSTSGP